MVDRHTGMKMAFVRDMIQIMRIIGEKKSMIRIQTVSYTHLATVTKLDDKIIPYITNICKRDPRSGKVVTGGIVSCKDSSWLLSWTINRQGQFKDQDKDKVCVWVYGCLLYTSTSVSDYFCGDVHFLHDYDQSGGCQFRRRR